MVRVGDDFLKKKRLMICLFECESMLQEFREKKRTLTFVLHSIASFTAAATALSLMSISSMAFEKKENKSISNVYDCLVTIKRCNRSVNDQMAPRSLIFLGQYIR